MRKISTFLALTLLSAQLSATYIVILKNGTRYRAKERWTISNGKAMVRLENGTTMQLDPNLIDVAGSEEATRSGFGDAKVIATPTQSTGKAAAPSLGETIRLRRQQQGTAAAPSSASGAPGAPGVPAIVQPSGGPGTLGSDVTSKFISAYENVGFFDAKVMPSAPYTLRVQLNADNEEQAFKAISATAYVMLRVPSLTNKRLDLVELFMSTINGGSSGRFQMTQEDATAIDSKKMTLEQYFIRKVIF